MINLEYKQKRSANNFIVLELKEYTQMKSAKFVKFGVEGVQTGEEYQQFLNFGVEVVHTQKKCAKHVKIME